MPPSGAFEVTRKLPAYERGRDPARDRGGHPRRAARSSARLIAAESGKPIRDALVEVDRATLTFRLGAEEAERIDGRGHPARPARVVARTGWASPGDSRSARSRRISPFNFPLNLAAHKVAPAIAVGLPDRAQAPSKDPLIDAHGGRDHRRSRRARGHGQHPADDPRAGRPDGRGRALQAADVHRLAVGRLADEGARGQEEGRARARRQRRRDRRQDGGPRLGRQAHASSGRSATPARCASASSGCSCTRTCGTRSWTSSSPPPRRSRWATRLDPTTRRRARWSTRRPRAAPRTGSTRRRRSAARSCSAARPTAPTSRRRCSPTSRTTPRSARTRRSRRSWSRSRSATSTTPSAQVNDSFFGLQTGVFTNDLRARLVAASRSSRSAASSSTTSRPTGSTTCPTAASRTPASGREGLRWAIDDMTEVRIMVLAWPQ